MNSVSLRLEATPALARLVRMTAANIAVLSSMSVDRVEDLRMAAEEAFVLACSCIPGQMVTVDFDADDQHVGMTFDMGDASIVGGDDSASTYADLILTSVCDSYEKLSNPTRLVLDMKADV